MKRFCRLWQNLAVKDGDICIDNGVDVNGDIFVSEGTSMIHVLNVYYKEGWSIYERTFIPGQVEEYLMVKDVRE